MPNAASLNPILTILAAPSGASKSSKLGAFQGYRPGLFQEGEFAGLLGLLDESGGVGRERKGQPGLPNQKNPDISGEALLVGLIGQILLQKKDSFLNDQLGPQAKHAYRALLEAYIGVVSSSKGEESKGLEHSDGGKAVGKMPSLNRALPATGLLGVSPKMDEGILSGSSAPLQEKVSAAPILSKTPLDPSRMGRLSPANAETDRLLELLSTLVHPQSQAKQGQSSSFTPPLLKPSAQASKPGSSAQAPGPANPTDGKGRVEMFAGLLDELYGSSSKSSAEKLQAALESRFSDHHAWPNLKETPEFASKIQAENALEDRQKAMPLPQSKDKQDANISFQEAMASGRSFRPTNTEAQEVTRQLQEAILGPISQDRPATQQRHTIVLALEPPDLGELAVRLDLKGNDLKVSIVANSHEAGQALKQGQAGLQQNLREQGLDLTQFSLSIANQGSFSKEFEGFSGQSSMPHTVNLPNGQEAASSNAILPVLPYHKGMLSIRV